MNCIPYDARNQLYKSIFGAITDSETLRLRILIHRDARLTCAFMVLQDDNKKTEQIEMLPAEQYDSSYRWYECNLQKPVGIYRYSFFYESPFGRMDITRFKYSQGIVSADGEQWQLTVYSSAEKAPQNYSGGIIYQIFPDRFKKSGEIIKGFSDRMINEHWGAQPLYENNVIGKDYFGGNLKGITESLDYIKSLGTTMIYLNPIFESHSNHRYNTADYLKIDPTLGTNEDFIALCQEAHSRDIKIILDGVFSHTGDDSLYFNKYGRYKGGAWNDPNSSYYNWYDFGNYPTGYKCWWGVPSLPEIREENEEYIEFITGNNGVLEHWMRLGADGFRLDVADELPDQFLNALHRCVKRVNPNAIIIGEVWEDATNKVSYGHLRHYLLGGQLDSVMNYPFSNAIISFVKGGDAFDFLDKIMCICENYPRPALNLLMNHIGTHDTARILTVLGGEDVGGRSRKWQSEQFLSTQQYGDGKRLLRLAAALQYTLPGIPSLYYGDEIGMQGYGDPFCRGCFSPDSADTELSQFYKQLGELRHNNSAFAGGEFIPLFAGLGPVCYVRKSFDNEVLIAVNRWHQADRLFVGEKWENSTPVFGNACQNGYINLAATDFTILVKNFENE